MSDILQETYQIINGLTNPAASEQDKTVARVVLAGWRIEPWQEGYRLRDPSGIIRSVAKTRYTAALRAELYIWHWDKTTVLFPY